VTAINFPCGSSKSKAELDNPGETVEARIDELGGTCNKSRRATISVEKGRASSPFEMVQSSCQGRTIGGTCINPNNKDSYSPYMPSGQGLFGIIDLEMDSESVAYGANSTPEASLTIGNIKIEGGSQTKNRIKSGLQRGIRKLIIDKRLDPQIRYIANNFTKMNISLKRPDFRAIGDDLNTLQSLFSEMKQDTTTQDTPRVDPNDSRSTLNQRTQSLNDHIANPFEQLATLFNKTNLINIQTKKLTVKIPMIYNEDINTYEIYLRQRASTNAEIIEQRTIRVDSLLGTCFSDKADAISDRFQQLSTLEEKDPTYKKELERINTELQKELKNGKCSAASDIKSQEMIMQMLKGIFKFINDYERMLDQINANILTLQEYRNFPFELYERVHAIDRYMAEISAIVNNLFGYLSFWMTTNANRFSSYVDAIILIMNVIKTYQILVDFSTNRSSKCGTCTNDTYNQNNCKLAILCQFFNIQLPILQIPNFKIPNIILDFSELNVGLDLLLPVFNFQPAKVDLPNIPNLPTPPNLQIDLNIFAKL
jgi:hypothetical protein